MYGKLLETEADRIERRAGEEAFWNRPDDKVLADLAWGGSRTKQPQQFSATNIVYLEQWCLAHTKDKSSSPQ
jgi:hypothetical protein